MDAAGAVTTKWRVDASGALPAPLAAPDLMKCASVLMLRHCPAGLLCKVVNQP